MFVKLCILCLIGVILPFQIKANDNDDEKICMTESLFKSVLKMNNNDQWQGLSKDRSQAERPAFFAFLKNSITFSGNDVLKFDVVTTNIGNGYNKDTGLFTAPRDGVYIFGCVMVTSGGNALHFYIYKNSNYFILGYISKNNSNTQHVILELKKGDTFSIRHRGSGSEGVVGGYHSYVFGYQLNK